MALVLIKEGSLFWKTSNSLFEYTFNFFHEHMSESDLRDAIDYALLGY
jgi:hypothetical protein